MHDQTSLARFEQEALAVARLRHPNIVAAYDFGRHQGRLYFVMELIEGIDVEKTIEQEGPLDERVAWKLVRQAAAGLSHAASAGIIHRDIKPANLLLVEPPSGFELPGGLKMVKITDFGLAFLSRDVDVKTRLTQQNTAIGSPHYLRRSSSKANRSTIGSTSIPWAPRPTTCWPAPPPSTPRRCPKSSPGN